MPRRKDHTREELKAMALKAGAEILKTQGVTALSARQIARNIGYTVGTLYNVFENFNDILFHLNAQTMQHMHQVFDQVIAENKSADSKKMLFALTHAYVDFAHSHASSWRLLFEPRISDQETPEWYQREIKHLFLVVEQALLPIFNQDHPQAKMAAKVLWASLYGICILSITGKVDSILGETARSLADSLIKNFLHT